MAEVQNTPPTQCTCTPSVRNSTHSIKIDHCKTNRSIETKRCELVIWYRLVSVNRWSIDSHIKLSANYIDFHRLAILIGYWLLFRWKLIRVSCHIDCSFINRLIFIDFDRLTNSSIAYVGMYCIVYQYMWLLGYYVSEKFLKDRFYFSFSEILTWTGLSHSMILGFWVSLLLGCILLRLFQNENARNKPFSEFCSFWNWNVTQKNASSFSSM